MRVVVCLGTQCGPGSSSLLLGRVTSDRGGVTGMRQEFVCDLNGGRTLANLSTFAGKPRSSRMSMRGQSGPEHFALARGALPGLSIRPVDG